LEKRSKMLLLSISESLVKFRRGDSNAGIELLTYLAGGGLINVAPLKSRHKKSPFISKRAFWY